MKKLLKGANKMPPPGKGKETCGRTKGRGGGGGERREDNFWPIAHYYVSKIFLFTVGNKDQSQVTDSVISDQSHTKVLQHDYLS